MQSINIVTKNKRVKDECKIKGLLELIIITTVIGIIISSSKPDCIDTILNSKASTKVKEQQLQSEMFSKRFLQWKYGECKSI